MSPGHVSLGLAPVKSSMSGCGDWHGQAEPTLPAWSLAPLSLSVQEAAASPVSGQAGLEEHCPGPRRSPGGGRSCCPGPPSPSRYFPWSPCEGQHNGSQGPGPAGRGLSQRHRCRREGGESRAWDGTRPLGLYQRSSQETPSAGLWEGLTCQVKVRLKVVPDCSVPLL